MKSKSKYPPFKKEEILATGRNWFAVQNSAFNNDDVVLCTSRGKDYVVSEIGASFVYYLCHKATPEEVIKQESFYRVADYEYMDGLGKKLVPIRSLTTARRILEAVAKDFKQTEKEMRKESELRKLLES